MMRVIPHLCQPWLYKRSQCRRCIDVCPVDGCIRFDGETVSVDNEKCISCGICTNVCPTSALVIEGLPDGELWNRLNTPPVEGSLLFGCTLGPDETVRSGTLRSATPRPKQKNSINLPCLAILKEAHLAALILSGVEEIHLDLTRCSGCSLAKGRDTIDAAVKQARALLDKLGRKDRIKVIDEPPPDEKGAKKGRKGRRAKVKEITPGPEYSRRELFSFLKDKAGEKAQERVFGHGHNPETVAREVGMTERRAVLVGALKGAFEDTDPPARLEEGTFPVHNLGILDKCTMCVRCEAFCPTGAVKTAE
jgi:ferredoxin